MNQKVWSLYALKTCLNVEVARSSNIGFIFAAKTIMLSWRKTATPRPNPQYYLKDHHNSYSDVFMHIIFISLYSLFTTTKYLRKWINSLSLRLSKNRCTYVCICMYMLEKESCQPRGYRRIPSSCVSRVWTSSMCKQEKFVFIGFVFPELSKLYSKELHCLQGAIL